MPKILLVEDNEMNRDMLSRRLQRRGHSVVIANDGEEGLSLASKEMPDIILMDISLPMMDGCEVTRRLKADERTRHIPVIALTAHALVTDRVKAINAGCDDYDTKPIEFSRLSEKIHNCLLEKKTL
jgi:CheY-like chemotaxis protein